jgi:hypothetical protein
MCSIVARRIVRTEVSRTAWPRLTVLIEMPMLHPAVALDELDLPGRIAGDAGLKAQPAASAGFEPGRIKIQTSHWCHGFSLELPVCLCRKTGTEIAASC